VGSVNERPGITGISHFFEHMMFKGTRTIGTQDPAKDLEYIRDQEVTRSSLREMTTQVQYQRWREGEIENPWDAADDTDAMSELRAEMRKLQESQRDITVKNEFDQIYTSMGASGLNAFTSYDITYAMTGGGPGTATTMLSFQIWKESFSMLNFGNGSAVAFIMVLISVGFILAIVKALPSDLFGEE